MFRKVKQVPQYELTLFYPAPVCGAAKAYSHLSTITLPKSIRTVCHLRDFVQSRIKSGVGVSL